MDGTGGPELDLRGVCFVGVPVKLAPNRLDPEPENDGKEGVKAPNIVVCKSKHSETRDGVGHVPSVPFLFFISR